MTCLSLLEVETHCDCPSHSIAMLEGFWLNLLIGSNFAGQYSGKIKRVSLYVVINNEEDGHGRRLSIRTCQSLGAINKRL